MTSSDTPQLRAEHAPKFFPVIHLSPVPSVVTTQQHLVDNCAIAVDARPRVSPDFIGEVIDAAVLRFGGTDRVFNAAGVSAALSLLFRVQEAIDGQRIHAFLARRPDVACLGPSMYRRLRGPLPKE